MRALRRHHRARIRRRARRLLPHWTDIDKLAEHLQYCRCPYCINPRRLAGHPVTRQERVADLQRREALALHYETCPTPLLPEALYTCSTSNPASLAARHCRWSAETNRWAPETKADPR